MNKQKSLRRAMLGAGLSILLCIGMLVGTTFAWFTDSVSVNGNVITAGNLSINVLGYDATGTLVADYSRDTTPIISETNWEPGSSDTKYITVTNTGSLPLQFVAGFKVPDNQKLGEVLWYNFQDMGVGSTAASDLDLGTPWVPGTVVQMSTLGSFNTGNQVLAPGQSITYRLDYGMNECAGNTYQGLSFTADISVVATQSDPGYKTTPTIGVDVVPVSTAAEFAAVINTDPCKTIMLMNDIVVNGDLDITKAVNFDLNGHNLYVTGTLTLDVNQNYGSMDIGGGSIIASAYVNNISGSIVLNGESNIVTGHVVAVAPGNLNFRNYATGDMLVLSEGAYNIVTNNPDGFIGTGFADKLTVVGAGIDKTVINVSNVANNPGINFSNANDCMLSNLTVASTSTFGSAYTIKVAPTSNNITIKNVKVEGGKGLNIDGGTNVVIDSVVVENSIGAGISVGGQNTPSSVTISNTTASGAWGPMGIMNSGAASITVTLNDNTLAGFYSEVPAATVNYPAGAYTPGPLVGGQIIYTKN